MGTDEHEETWSAVAKLAEIRKALHIGPQMDVIRVVQDLVANQRREEILAGDAEMPNDDTFTSRLFRDTAKTCNRLHRERDSLLAEIRTLTQERDEAERAALYFAKRLESLHDK